ncbi:hypothetical protein B9Z55_004100 [Caenorhabditis nigoni]|uniref:F-box domain-containing protein n=1 Tax=Caenorhabditis nigoni TaxID=1611254 RepID=A0A2G5UUW7_9PELO|nr:hypothetical protein B9Z55_004100 [Caenorhabditis nigoni]
MSSDIEKSMRKTEKLSVDSTYDTNWCDMPPEVKSRCIGKMEFKERLSLRCTAKAERSLVDLAKIEFQKGSISGQLDDGDFELTLYFENGSEISFKSMNERLELMKYIWKVGVFEQLNISMTPLFPGEEAPAFKEKFFACTEEISAKNIHFGFCDIGIILHILRNTKDGVESIEMDGSGNPHPFDEILAIPQVQQTKYWHIINHDNRDGLHKVAQVWIDNNSNIGSICQLSLWTNVYIKHLFDEFLEHCAERIVSMSEERVRIRTDSPDRHILLECVFPRFLRLLVISADMKDSEYDYDYETWIRRIDSWRRG